MEQIWTTTIGKQNGIDLLNALAQWHCSNVEPVITYPCQNWADTGNNVWKQRNEANDGWIVRGTLDSAYFGLALSNSIIPLDGWISGLTAAYASATSIIIAGIDVTDRIQKGTKIRYKQGNDYKYDFVSEVSFATDSTLTLMGGSTVEEEAITDFAYSNIANPIGWPFGVDYIEEANANGTWRKWADGTLECWGTETFTSVAITTLWGGSIYTSPQESVTWPISFAVIESANINVLAQTPTQFVPALIDFVSSYQGKFYFWRPASFTYDSITVGFYVKGRWK